MRRGLLLGLLLPVASACDVPEEGPWMLPGSRCMTCHEAGGSASERPWSVAGTVFDSETADAGLQGAVIEVVDQDGRLVRMPSNGAGNFYTAESLRFPIRASLVIGGVRREMPGEVEHGSCNSCHGAQRSEAPLAPDD